MASALTVVNGKLLKRQDALGADAACCHPCYMQCGTGLDVVTDVTTLRVTISSFPDAFQMVVQRSDTLGPAGTVDITSGGSNLNGSYDFDVIPWESNFFICNQFNTSLSGVTGNINWSYSPPGDASTYTGVGTNPFSISILPSGSGSGNLLYNCGTWATSVRVTINFNLAYGNGFDLSASGLWTGDEFTASGSAFQELTNAGCGYSYETGNSYGASAVVGVDPGTGEPYANPCTDPDCWHTLLDDPSEYDVTAELVA